MRPISETKALGRLAELKREFKRAVAPHEMAAKSCVTCETPGACCLDAHFVNVRISRLEAVAIDRHLATLPPKLGQRVDARRVAAIEKYGLSTGNDDAQTYACPLFEPGVGCLVHDAAKPLPCIHHACYERADDMPPADLLTDAELAVDELDRRAYLTPRPTLPLPVALGQRY